MMDAAERARLRELADKWAVWPASAPCAFEFTLAGSVTRLLDALDAAEQRLAAVQALVDDHLVCTCGGADDVVLADKLSAALRGHSPQGGPVRPPVTPTAPTTTGPSA